jgi:hypothetical protein
MPSKIAAMIRGETNSGANRRICHSLGLAFAGFVAVEVAAQRPATLGGRAALKR